MVSEAIFQLTPESPMRGWTGKAHQAEGSRPCRGPNRTANLLCSGDKTNYSEARMVREANEAVLTACRREALGSGRAQVVAETWQD